MQWDRTYALALALGVLSTSNAFVVVDVRSSSRRRFNNFAVGSSLSGWDNENFLESLSRGPDAIQKANEQYEALSRFGRRPGPSENDDEEDAPQPSRSNPQPSDEELLRGDGITKGALLTEEMKAQVKASHTPEEEAAQGGKMFRDLLERAKQGGGVAARISVPPPTPPPPNSFPNLSVEEQAQLFQQMMMQQLQQQQAPPQTPYNVAAAAAVPPPPAPLPRSTSPDGRPLGRNRDADAIVNSSDVYFAQLKIDSTTRNLARYKGDNELANAVFADPTIATIKMHVNPYLEEIKRKEQELLDTAADEMLLPYVTQTQPQQPISSSGISYKDKFQARMQSTPQGAFTSSTASTTTREQTPRPPPPFPVEAMAQVTPQWQSPPPPAAVEAPVPRYEPPPTAAAVPKPPTAARSEDDKRKDIRTFMGMLLKHRGGDGFGAGRLTGVEVTKFQELASRLVEELQQEAHTHPAAPADAQGAAMMEPTTSSPSPLPQQPASSGGSVNGMIACIEGAIQMYKNCPPDLQEGVLVTLRAALVSAIQTLNQVEPNRMSVPSLEAVLKESATPPSTLSSPGTGSAIARVPTAPVAERINRMISLIEGAILMYRNSPLELQEGILVTIRAALLSAIGTLNEIVAKNELKNFEAYRTAISDPRTRTSKQAKSERPTQFYDVTPELFSDASQDQAGDNLAGLNNNAQFFAQVYAKLEDAKGEGKMGLRSDLSPSEAAELAADLVKMRSLMVQELDNGAAPAKSMAEKSTEASSKYQEMLAKARAQKATDES